MTAFDRLIEAVGDDGPVPREAQVALVESMLSRRLDAPPFAEQTTWTCPNCLRDWPENYCQECGQRLNPEGAK